MFGGSVDISDRTRVHRVVGQVYLGSILERLL